MAASSATPPPAERTLHLALAARVLQAWAENRQQVQVPLALSLPRLPPDHRALVVQAMAAALAARGGTPAEDAAGLETALPRIGGTEQDGRAALTGRPDLFALLAALDEAGLAAHGYAAAALLLDRRVAMERAFLDWLAGRLALPASVVHGLQRRYGR